MPKVGELEKGFGWMRLLVIAGGIVCLDQATKALVLAKMPLYQSIEVIPGFFNLTHVHNPGGAFSFLANQPQLVRQVVFLFVSGLAAALVLHFYRKVPTTLPWLANAFAAIFGGAVGNMIDRLRMGAVVDFLDFDLILMRWPTFNVADSAICVGICVFALHLITNRIPE